LVIYKLFLSLSIGLQLLIVIYKLSRCSVDLMVFSFNRFVFLLDDRVQSQFVFLLQCDNEALFRQSKPYLTSGKSRVIQFYGYSQAAIFYDSGFSLQVITVIKCSCSLVYERKHD